VIDVLIYRQTERWSAIELAFETSRNNDRFQFAGATEIARGAMLNVTLELPWSIEPQAQTVRWAGETTKVSFHIVPSKNYPARPVLGRCIISTEGMTIGHIFFQMTVDQSGVTDDWRIPCTRFIQSAFASYASKDRRRVLARVQGIEKLGVKVFMDTHGLRSNEQY
jgi:hypothetical protein